MHSSQSSFRVLRRMSSHLWYSSSFIPPFQRSCSKYGIPSRISLFPLYAPASSFFRSVRVRLLCLLLPLMKRRSVRWRQSKMNLSTPLLLPCGRSDTSSETFWSLHLLFITQVPPYFLITLLFNPLFRILVERQLYFRDFSHSFWFPGFRPAPFISIRSVWVFPLSYHDFTFTSFWGEQHGKSWHEVQDKPVNIFSPETDRRWWSSVREWMRIQSGLCEYGWRSDLFPGTMA